MAVFARRPAQARGRVRAEVGALLRRERGEGGDELFEREALQVAREFLGRVEQNAGRFRRSDALDGLERGADELRRSVRADAAGEDGQRGGARLHELIRRLLRHGGRGAEEAGELLDRRLGGEILQRVDRIAPHCFGAVVELVEEVFARGGTRELQRAEDAGGRALNLERVGVEQLQHVGQREHLGGGGEIAAVDGSARFRGGDGDGGIGRGAPPPAAVPAAPSS